MGFFFFDPIVLLPLSIHVTFGGPAWTHSVGKTTEKSHCTIVQKGQNVSFISKWKDKDIFILLYVAKIQIFDEIAVERRHFRSFSNTVLAIFSRLKVGRIFFFCCCCYFSFLPWMLQNSKRPRSKASYQKVPRPDRVRVGLFFTCLWLFPYW